jgi:hypothetical protein
MVSFIPWLLNPWRRSLGTSLDEMGRRKTLPLPEPELHSVSSQSPYGLYYSTSLSSKSMWLLFHSDIFRAKFPPLRIYEAGPGYIKLFVIEEQLSR